MPALQDDDGGSGAGAGPTGAGAGGVSVANADAERTLLRIKQKLEGAEFGGRGGRGCCAPGRCASRQAEHGPSVVAPWVLSQAGR